MISNVEAGNVRVLTLGDTRLTLGAPWSSGGSRHVPTRPFPLRPMIALTAAVGLIDAIAAGGGDPDAVLASVGLTREVVGNTHGFIPSSDFARLLEAAAV